MKFYIDTFSWKKIDILSELGIFNISPVYDAFEICITHSILKEITHFNLKSFAFTNTQVMPHKDNKIYQDALTLGFDEADASIVSHGLDEEETYIISEDKPLLTFGKGFGIKIIQLIDFMKVLTHLQVVSKKNLYQINRTLRGVKNISKKKEKSIKNWLNELD